jgi:hypothetical protein
MHGTEPVGRLPLPQSPFRPLAPAWTVSENRSRRCDRPTAQRERAMRTLAVLPLLMMTQAGAADAPVPSLSDVVAARRDLWGELALQQPNGASYEFFESLLPPPRYVHADFRYYPLVLSAPGTQTKARLISNGSGVNLHGGSRSWRRVGTAIAFRVGIDEFRFGGLRDRVSQPHPANGWLPIYEITYRHPSPVKAEGAVPIDQKPSISEGELYRLEAFVSTDPALAENAVVFVSFSLAAGSNGFVSVQIDPPTGETFQNGQILDEQQNVLAVFDPSWKWQRQGARARLKPGTVATLAIPTKPLETGRLAIDAKSYETHRRRTVQAWTSIVNRATRVDVPEARVNHAWRSLLVQNHMLLQGDRMFYSAGNQYEQLYEAEGSDAGMGLRRRSETYVRPATRLHASRPRTSSGRDQTTRRGALLVADA